MSASSPSSIASATATNNSTEVSSVDSTLNANVVAEGSSSAEGSFTAEGSPPAESSLLQLDLGQLQGLVDAGGPVIIILSILSLVAMSVFLFKFWQFFSTGLNKQKNITTALELWRNNHAKNAITILGKTRNPIARVLEVAINLKSQEHIDDILIKEEILRIAKRQLASARSHLRILEVIATLSPLLGLLGTVLGMITAFQKLQGAGATIDPSVLSGGIWEALLTTAAGLIVAIPTVMALNWLEQKIEHFKLNMEDAMTQIFTANLSTSSISHIALKVASTPKRAVKETKASNVDLVPAN